MKRGGTVGSAMGALALTALFMFRGAGPGPKSSSDQGRGRAKTELRAETKKKAKGTLPEEGPWRASRDHFSGLTVPNEGQKNCSAGLQRDDDTVPICDPRRDLWLIPPDENVQAMIAVVPDPVHTHLALAFDRTVEALQLAAGTSNYVVDRFWLPWDTNPKPEFSDYDSVKDADKDQRAKLQQPGLMIFRYDGEIASPAPGVVNDKGKKADAQALKTGSAFDVAQARIAGEKSGLLYIFLVADTAAGINGTQFGKAVGYLQQICRSPEGCILPGATPKAGKAVVRSIHIMGPMFSGSLASLRLLTRAAPGTEFTAYSGTVSSICAAQDQHLAVGSKELCNAQITPKELVPGLSFRSFVVDSELATGRLIEFLKNNGEINCGSESGPQVAILSETATTYGAAQQSAGRSNRSGGRKESYGPESVKEAAKETAAKKPEAPTDYMDDSREEISVDRSCWTNFAYPREISSLRNAYQNSVSETSGAVKSGDSRRPYLSFTLNDRQNNNSDEPQDFSAQQGPLSKEAVLMKMADELREHHYRYIGIVGTNTLDVLFLSNFLRSAFPNARIFVTNSDLMFERELDNASFVGMLSVSTYPLVSRNLNWSSSGAQPDRLPFSDQFEQGQYNATVSLLHRMLPGHIATIYEAAAPFSGAAREGGKLPIWLTVVGTGGYWPVRLLSPAEPVKDPAPAAALRKEDFSSAWMCITLLLCVYSCLHAWAVLKGNPVDSFLRDLAAETPQAAQRLFFIHVGSAILALMVVLMAMPAWTSAGAQTGIICWLGAVAVGTILVLLGSSVAREVRWSQKSVRSGWLALHAGMWVAAAILGVLWAAIFQEKIGDYGLFFAYRTVHLATGVSPVTPIVPLLGAGYVWTIFEILRLRFSEEMRPRLSSSSGPASPPPPASAAVRVAPVGGSSERPVADALRRYFLASNYTTAAAMVFLLWLMFFNPLHPFVMFEDWKFGFLYGLFFCVTVMMILSAGFRFGQVWGPLRKMLGEMERSRIRCTFQRLKHSDWSPIWRQGGQETEWLNLSRSVEALGALLRANEAADSEASRLPADLIKAAEGTIQQAAEVKAIYETLKESKSAMRDGRAGLEIAFTTLQEQLAITLKQVLTVLESWWKQECCAPQDNIAAKSEAEVKDAVKEALREVARGVADDSDDPAKKAEQRRLRQLARMEEFVAWRYEGFIRTVLGHMKHSLMFLAVAFSLVLISLNLYAFEPHDSLLWSLTVIFIVLGALTIVSLMQIHRDPILSRMSGTTPNDLGLEFYVRIVSFGAAPLITLLATHFPSIGRYVTSFLQPGLEALK